MMQQKKSNTLNGGPFLDKQAPCCLTKRDFCVSPLPPKMKVTRRNILFFLVYFENSLFWYRNEVSSIYYKNLKYNTNLYLTGKFEFTFFQRSPERNPLPVVECNPQCRKSSQGWRSRNAQFQISQWIHNSQSYLIIKLKKIYFLCKAGFQLG